MKKRISLIILALCLVSALFIGCEKSTNTTVVSSTNNNSSKEQAKPEETPEEMNYSPFTGLPVENESSLLNRPVAVMVNNIQIALPQKGISKADIIYELPVEGPITRLMAVFGDYNNLPEIGSIRSARHDYVELLTPFNPIYLHFGGSEAGKNAIAKNKIDDIDGLSLSTTAFHKDAQRAATKGTEHSYFSSGELLKKGIAKKGFTTTIDNPTTPIFRFAKPEVDVMAENASAAPTAKISIKMSSTVTATFDYDAQTKLYSKGQFGQPHIDSATNKACAVKNVLIMFTDVGLLPNGKNKEVNLSTGTGYYISNGKRIEVQFKKAAVKNNLSVTDLSGKEIQLNAGQTWICIAPKEYKSNTIIS